MLIKLKRKLLKIRKLFFILISLLIFYLVLFSSSFYAPLDYKSSDHNQPLRNYLVNFLKNLDFNDLNLDSNLDANYASKFFVKNLLQRKPYNQIDYDDYSQNYNPTSYDFDYFQLMSFKLTNLKDLNLNELNFDKLNIIKSNFKKFTTIDLLSLVIKIKNHHQLVLNLDKFSLNDFEFVITVQVHKRINYLKILIDSLSKVNGIENVLLIFSHDLFDLEINKLIEEIQFCKVMQIFYPYSIQLHPNSFPGPSRRDCPRDISYSLAKLIHCNNADFPDHYGHYREAKFCQIKHHWFFKINYIFDKLSITKRFDGIILFLEEDNYVLPDLLFILKILHLENVKKNQVDLISMGAHVRSLIPLATFSNYAINEKFSSVRNNMGMALTRTLFYNKIKKCATQFCEFDDYNWDWSLEHISKKCLKTELRTTNLMLPRVLHLGKCGFHTHDENCEDYSLINEFNSLIKNQNILFPKQIKIKTLKNHKKESKKKEVLNGGWADIRDHQLCLNFTI